MNESRSKRLSNSARRGPHADSEDTPQSSYGGTVVMATAVAIDSDEYLKHPDSHQVKSQVKSQANSSSKSVNAKHPPTSVAPPTLGSSSLEFARDASNGPCAWPAKLKTEVIESLNKPLNEANGNKFLEKNKWPEGLRKALFKACKKIPIRFFIVDDSGKRTYCFWICI